MGKYLWFPVKIFPTKPIHWPWNYSVELPDLVNRDFLQVAAQWKTMWCSSLTNEAEADISPIAGRFSHRENRGISREKFGDTLW